MGICYEASICTIDVHECKAALSRQDEAGIFKTAN